ncbi:hypothetical protein Mapa_003352 [Marchantia paleacea]|nr:hypothetical protein Mapa_003352 [Marchantia paleacea]
MLHKHHLFLRFIFCLLGCAAVCEGLNYVSQIRLPIWTLKSVALFVPYYFVHLRCIFSCSRGFSCLLLR